MADPENKFAADMTVTSDGAAFFESSTPAPASPPTPEQQALAEAARRLAVRDALLQEARDNFDSIAGAAETPYSRSLQELQVKLNAYLKLDPSFYSRAVVFDRAKMDAAMAIGFGEIDAVKKVLAREGVTLGDNASDNGDALRVASKAVDKAESRFGLNIYTQNAANLGDVGLTDPAYVIVPEPDHAQIGPVTGMTPRDDEDYSNRHESWHAKDSKYSSKGMPPAIWNYAGDYHAQELSEDPDLRKAYVMRFRKEALADTGAVGDMIREGRDFSVLDKILSWRTESPDDSIHFSPAVLAGLKKEISGIGLEKFRAYTDREAKEFYYNVVEKYGISEKAIAAAARYDMAPDDKKAAIEAEAKTDPEIKRGLDFRAAISVKKPDAGPNVLSVAEIPLKQQLDKWDAEKILQDKAFEMAGRVTPASLVKAYGALESDLQKRMELDPANSLLYDLQMSKLQTTFIERVKATDYVEVNRQRGVKIEEVETSLSKFIPPARVSEAETAPETAPVPKKNAPVLKL